MGFVVNPGRTGISLAAMFKGESANGSDLQKPAGQVTSTAVGVPDVFEVTGINFVTRHPEQSQLWDRYSPDQSNENAGNSPVEGFVPD